MIKNLGINYEVALEFLGQSMQPFIRAIADERAKPTPSAALVAYCEARKTALSRMQNHLRLDDQATITAILDRDDPHAHLFR
jgi:hypothetical protein